MHHHQNQTKKLPICFRIFPASYHLSNADPSHRYAPSSGAFYFFYDESVNTWRVLLGIATTWVLIALRIRDKVGEIQLSVRRCPEWISKVENQAIDVYHWLGIFRRALPLNWPAPSKWCLGLLKPVKRPDASPNADDIFLVLRPYSFTLPTDDLNFVHLHLRNLSETGENWNYRRLISGKVWRQIWSIAISRSLSSSSFGASEWCSSSWSYSSSVS